MPPKKAAAKSPLKSLFEDVKVYQEGDEPGVLKALVPTGQPLNLDNETGREQKYGGNVPFFKKGEKWPTKGKDYYLFVAQFIDPARNQRH
jgi:hypothetical protein